MKHTFRSVREMSSDVIHFTYFVVPHFINKMSFQYKCSVGNYLREELQEHRETISEMQKTIDDLVFQRDQAMDDIAELLPQYEYWRRRAEYFERINANN